MRSSATAVILATFTIMSASGCEQKAREPSPASGQAAAGETRGTEPARATPMLVDDDGRTKVSVKTPKGVSVSLSVPSDWVEIPRPQKVKLVVMRAPAGAATSGVKATVLAKEFEGSQKDLIVSTRARLESSVSINTEGPVRVGPIDAYEFSVSWTTPVGKRRTTERLIATGSEAITVACQVPPSALDSAGAVCDEIFATLSIE